MAEKTEGMMPGEKDLGRPHHREPESQPGKLPGEAEKGERGLATINEFKESLEGLPKKVVERANLLRRGLRVALTEEDKEKLGDVLRETSKLVNKEPRLERWSDLMEQEATGEVKPGQPSEKRKGQEREEKGLPEQLRPEEIEEIPDKIDQTRTKEDKEVLADPRSERMKAVEERYVLWGKPLRPIEELQDQYLRYLAGIGARQPVPGQGIAAREWEEIARYTGEIDGIIRQVGKIEEKKRTDEDKKILKDAERLKRVASAYYHELEYYHRFWYGDLEGIGKSVYRPKEGSRLLLIDQMGVLFTIPKVVEAFKKEKGYKSDAELINEVDDPYGWRRLGHHLRRYSCTPMYRDSYEQGIKIGKPGEPGYGESYEYSLFGLYFTKKWAEQNNPKNAKLLEVKDRDGNLIVDLGELGTTYDMWTTPSRWRLYLLNWERLGVRNQIRLSAGREKLWIDDKEKALAGLLPEDESSTLRDRLWADRDGINPLSPEDKAKLVRFSPEEIRALQEILIKERINGEQPTDDEKIRLEEFQSVIIRNLVNRDLGFDPSEEDFDMIAVFSDFRSWHDRITPNDILTNILVDVRRMEQTQDSLAAGKESFISSPSFAKIREMENENYAHLGDLPWLKTREIDTLREMVTTFEVSKLVNLVNITGTKIFEDESKKIYDELRNLVGVGLHSRALKELYDGLDFTDPALTQNGASLEMVLAGLIRVHGRDKLKIIYAGENWFLDVLRNEKALHLAHPFSKERFLARFGFNNYATFERNIIEEPVLNAMDVTRGEGIESKLKERERTRNLWLAKKAQLPGDKGVFIKSRDQELRITEKDGGRRREGGRWLLGWWYETGKWEKVGYIDNNGVYCRTIVWEDPVQRNIFGIEQLIYTRNAEIISKFLDNHSPDLIDDPNEWLTVPQRQNYIRGQERDIAIDPDRADFLLKRYECTDADGWTWTFKRYIFGHIAPEFATKIPLVGPFAKSFNVAGFGAAGPLSALVGIGLSSFGPTAGIPVAAWTLAGLFQVGSWAFLTSPIVRRIARMRSLPLFNRLSAMGPFRLPWYYEPGGKVKEYLG